MVRILHFAPLLRLVHLHLCRLATLFEYCLVLISAQYTDKGDFNGLMQHFMVDVVDIDCRSAPPYFKECVQRTDIQGSSS